MSGSSRATSSNSQGRRSRSQSRSRSRAGSEVDAAEANGHGDAAGANAVVSQDDFCNNFWSDSQPAEGGGSGQERAYEALMGRNKIAGRMVEDLRSFFKERAAIEEEYARRMAKLARQPLGRDETGDFAAVLKRLQYELDQTGRCHNELANVIRSSLEARVKEFEGSRDARRKNMQFLIEKSWKNKQSQEVLVQKALEKYKSDCILINSFSARLSLTQGKDMDKVTAKLDKAQQTVQVNETEYKNYLKALKDTNTKWTTDWKAWCDLSQDLEEERLDFTRNALWSYVNALSLLCVKDDESCENVRQTIELCDIGREIQTYVHRDGGAAFIPESPHFVDFSDGDKGVAAPALHPAQFARSSAKIDIAAFDGLEKLQALIYPQQGQQRRSVAGTPAPTSSQPSPAPLTPAHSGPPPAVAKETPQRAVPINNAANETTPQPTTQAAAPIAISPVRREVPPPAPSKPEHQPPVPPAAFTATSAARSRPSSRAGPAGDDQAPQTTAEILQYQASQKRMSAGAFRPNVDKPTPSPHYPYATSPRAAKPYEPPAPGSEAELALKQSTSGMLPPPSGPATSTTGSVAAAPLAPVSNAKGQEKKDEDPLLAALAKLRNPSSAVDVLPASSPGILGGISPGAIGLPGMAGRSSAQPPRSHSPYGQPGPTAQGAPRSQSPYATAANARSNPNMNTYSRPVSMTQSQSQPGPLYGQQARSRPTSPQPPPSQQQQPPYQRAPSPAAAMMRPPSQPQTGGADVAATVTGYGQSFPGERRQSMSVPKAPGAQSRPSSPGAGLQSPVGDAPGGYAGVGASGGRASPNPGYNGQAHQHYQQGMRSPSPAPQSGYPQPQQQSTYQGQPFQQAYGQQQQAPPQPQQQRPTSAYGSQQQRMSQPPSAVQGHAPSGSYSGQGPPPAAGQTGASPTTPLGISLDATGSVTQDQMAEQYAHQQRAQTVSPRPYSQGGAPPPTSSYGANQSQANIPSNRQSAGYRHGASIYQQAQNRQSMVASPSQPAMQTPLQTMSPNYGYSPAPLQGTPQQGYGNYQNQQPQQAPGPQSPPYAPGSSMSHRPPSQNINRSQSMGYAQPNMTPQTQHMQTSQSYRGTPSQFANPNYPQQQQQQPQPQPQQQPQVYGQQGGYAGYSQPPPQSQHYHQQQAPPPQIQQQQPTQHVATQQPLQAPPSTNLPPTGQYTEAGQPILFYVKAIYKYDATSAEEFSFQKDDVIGVYETDDDGWWKGELLDPARARRSGGNLFPSNFTSFLD